MKSAGMAEMPVNQGVRGRKGVQQVDVDAAADAILAEGVRPTVERIRHRLGTGSPNTVAPMLEGWFKRLSARVAGLTQAGGGEGAPPAAQNAFRLLWDTALGEARAMAGQELAQERQQVDADREQLAEDARALRAARGAMDESLRLAQEQGAQHQARAGELAGTLQGVERQLHESQQRAATLQQQLDDERRRREEAAREHRIERERDLERVQANERRLLGDVDLARAEVKRLEKAVAAGAESLRAQSVKLEVVQKTSLDLTRQLAQAQQESVRLQASVQLSQANEGAAREMLAAANARIEELNAALSAERASAREAAKESRKKSRLSKKVSSRKSRTA